MEDILRVLESNSRDEKQNVLLAQNIVTKAHQEDKVSFLISSLEKSKTIASNAIKVIYEIGAEKPELIAPYFLQLKALLYSKQNRLQWGAMTAINSIAHVIPDEIYPAIPELLKVATIGSVITRDNAFEILVKLAKNPKHNAACIALIIEQLKSCPENQLAMYAEKALPVSFGSHSTQITQAINLRLKGVEKESKRKRLLKVIKKLETSE